MYVHGDLNCTKYLLELVCVQLLDEAPNPWMSKQDVGVYLREALLPEVASRQVKLTATPMTLKYLLEVVARVVDKHATLSLPEVRYIICLQPNWILKS